MGSGTGVVSLMLAQRSRAQITAIDINAQALKLTEQNFKESKFSGQFTSICDNFLSTKFEPGVLFDHILSNPPFYDQIQPLAKQEKDWARNSHHLKLDALLTKAIKYINNKGLISVVIPYELRDQTVKFSLTMELFLQKECLVCSKPNLKKRTLLTFSKTQLKTEFTSLTLRNLKGEMSSSFTEICAPYLFL